MTTQFEILLNQMKRNQQPAETKIVDVVDVVDDDDYEENADDKDEVEKAKQKKKPHLDIEIGWKEVKPGASYQVLWDRFGFFAGINQPWTCPVCSTGLSESARFVVLP